MPRKETIRKANRDKRAGKSPGTQAGEFVREEIDKIRHSEHGARSPQQAIAIGLSEARRAGVDLPPPRRGKAKAQTRRSAKYAYEAGPGPTKAAAPAACFPRGQAGAQTRAAKFRLATRTVATGQTCCQPPQCCLTFRGRPQGGQDQGCKGPFGRCEEGCAHKEPAEALIA